MCRGSDQFLGLFPFKLELLHRTLPRRTAGTRSSADELVRFDETPKYVGNPNLKSKPNVQTVCRNAVRHVELLVTKQSSVTSCQNLNKFLLV